jgi:hypothetical protein
MMVNGVRSSCDAFATNRRLPGERGVEAREHAIERVGQSFELVGRSLQFDAGAEVGRGKVLRGGGDLLQRAEDSTRNELPEPDLLNGHDVEGKERLDEQLVQRIGPHGRWEFREGSG